MTKKTGVKRLLFETYLATIKNSVGARIFRNFYALIGGKKQDIMKNGKLSCAFFVSSILRIFGLIKDIHGTVDGTVKDLKKSGWKVLRRPKTGSVLVWSKPNDSKTTHRHIGFYLGNYKAVSNSSTKMVPIVHRSNFNGKRKIEKVFGFKKTF